MGKIAIFTIIQDGGEFLKIWYKHYTNYVSINDIYIIDCESKDGVSQSLNCNLIEVEGYQITNVPPLNRCINNFKNDLLKNYDTVIFSDYDEILYHPKGFEYIINNIQGDYYTARGYEIVQNRNKDEKPIDFNKNILEQRNYWCRDAAYDKSLILKKPVHWAMGNHTVNMTRPVNGKDTIFHLKPNRTGDLYLLHLHKVDYDYCYQKNLRNIEEQKIPIIGGSHNFFTGNKFDYWWKTAENKLHPIPDDIKFSNFI